MLQAIQIGLLSLVFASLMACSGQASLNPPQPIARLELPRYLGSWYEIAKYPNRFQRDCVKNTRAEYSQAADGSVQVLNRCVRKDGSEMSASAEARLVGEPGTAKLEVRFAPAWLSWLPPVWGNYWVIDLDEAYSLAAVSEPSREYLWILSRHPHVDQAAYAALLARLQAKGFDLERLKPSPQDLQNPRDPQAD